MRIVPLVAIVITDGHEDALKQMASMRPTHGDEETRGLGFRF